MNDQQGEDILRRRAREQAEIERQTDALVLRTLTSMVTASEELKAKLRRDVEGLLDGYRRTKRQLDNEISLTTAERLRSRREAELERAEIVREAKAQAREIVEAAKREREGMLAEVRSMEQRLRSLEDQIRSVFGPGIPGLPERSADRTVETTAETPDAAAPFVPGSSAMLDHSADVSSAAMADDAAPDAGLQPDEHPGLVGEEPAPVAPVAGPEEPAAPSVEDASHEADDEERTEAPAAAVPPPSPVVPVDAAPPPAAAPSPVASLTPVPPAPASDRPSRPVPFPVRAYTQQSALARRRPVELVFDGVPGYQQASALERAVNDLLPNEEIDILQFDRGQLVLGLQAADLGRLADQLVAGAPASLELEAVAGDQARFRCV